MIPVEDATTDGGTGDRGSRRFLGLRWGRPVADGPGGHAPPPLVDPADVAVVVAVAAAPVVDVAPNGPARPDVAGGRATWSPSGFVIDVTPVRAAGVRRTLDPRLVADLPHPRPAAAGRGPGDDGSSWRPRPRAALVGAPVAPAPTAPTRVAPGPKATVPEAPGPTAPHGGAPVPPPPPDLAPPGAARPGGPPPAPPPAGAAPAAPPPALSLVPAPAHVGEPAPVPPAGTRPDVGDSAGAGPAGDPADTDGDPVDDDNVVVPWPGRWAAPEGEGEPRRTGGTRRELLVAALEDLAEQVPGVRGALVAADDGLPVVATLPEAEVARVAAVTAMVVGLSQRTLDRVGLGGFEETVIGGDEGVLVVYDTGAGAALAVAVDPTVNLGLVHLEARATARRLAGILAPRGPHDGRPNHDREV